MEPKPLGTAMDLLGITALATSALIGIVPSLQPLSLSLLGIGLMAGAFSHFRRNENSRDSVLPTISAALATCVAGYGIHASDSITMAMVAITAMVSVILQCVVDLNEMGEPDPLPVLDAEFVPDP